MPGRSRLARIQQITTLGTVALALGCAVWWWAAGGEALAGALIGLLVLGVQPLVLGLQFMVVAIINRRCTPAPTVAELVRAWWGEVWAAHRVFQWRQPFRWNEVPDCPAGAGSTRRGVVFVHGFVCNRGLWTPWLSQLQARGHGFVAVNLEPVFGSIEDCVPLIAQAVEAVTRATAQPPLVVCHSMGGLAVRAWLRSERAQPVHHVITIGTPHRGTWWARLSTTTNGRQMRLDSRWIAALPDPVAAGAGWTCWYSNADNIVLPTSTATLPGADNRLLRGVAHVDLAFQPEVMDHAFALLA